MRASRKWGYLSPKKKVSRSEKHQPRNQQIHHSKKSHGKSCSHWWSNKILLSTWRISYNIYIYMCIYIYVYMYICIIKKNIIDVDSLKIIQSHLPMGLWSDHPTARTFQKSEAEILNSDRGLDRQGSLFWSLPSTQKQWASHPCRERAACSKHLFSKVSTKFCQLDWIQTKSR